MDRRYFLQASAILGGAWVCYRGWSWWSSRAHTLDTVARTDAVAIHKTNAEWKQILTPAQFHILREHGTEPPGSSPLDHEYGKGTYVCAGCDQALFASATKFNSGTGWPSFYAPLPEAVGTSIDNSLLMTRVEVHCAQCGGHLGHVFNDGPPPTGQRYCMNGLALKFVAA